MVIGIGALRHRDPLLVFLLSSPLLPFRSIQSYCIPFTFLLVFPVVMRERAAYQADRVVDQNTSGSTFWKTNRASPRKYHALTLTLKTIGMFTCRCGPAVGTRSHCRQHLLQILTLAPKRQPPLSARVGDLSSRYAAAPRCGLMARLPPPGQKSRV